MTKKIFLEDVLQRSSEAVVTDCVELKTGFGIVLDQTVFYPEGGGQLSDTGKLICGDREVVVTHVRETEGRILHETAEPLSVGTQVLAEIDWQTRFDHMQQHCGEHLLSYGFWKICGADNVGFHMSPEMVTIDLSREVTSAEIAQVEALANLHIQENRPIKAEWMEAEKAAKCATRKFNDKLTGSVRVVQIEGSDACTCCGTHPPMTGMVGLVKIFKAEKHKQGTRIYFLCGRLAMEKISRCWQELSGAVQLLSIKDEEIRLGVERLQDEIKELKEKLSGAELRWVQEKARQLLQDTPLTDGVKSIILQEEDISADAARKLAQVLSEDPQAEVTIYYSSGGRINYVLASGSEVKVSCRERIKAINERLGGRGGGKDNFAQGSAEVR
ncbi:alanyl-tRNA editing protein [Selenomonas ruminantium]|uniref:Alanyl-tRNA synthetase n=1 Tax=Selenomonas ruminantium TaxID=971 RepID=A0A1K1QS26_SELRU|nr:alanine--tRNA ligase-related protein [Selenomonas ruminantium]SFW62746.1 alanyl-tRNA synthetase [Selenomonas ruminantium]